MPAILDRAAPAALQRTAPGGQRLPIPPRRRPEPPCLHIAITKE